jgi:RND family efflux transporter MFP subunit
MTSPDTSKSDLSTLRISRERKEGNGSSSAPWKIILPVALFLLAAALFVLLRGTFRSSREVEITTAVLTSPSQANAILTASGYVVAQQKAAVASKGTGRLVFLGVEEGDKVTKGMIIARLEDQDMQASLKRADANLQLARAEYNDAERTLHRQEMLFERNLTSQAELDAAHARFERVNASIASAEAAVSEARVALENTRIRAPFDGTVLTKNADVGEVVAPFAASLSSRGAVVTIADLGSLQVEADVSESNIMRVRAGQPCEIVLDAYPQKRYPGTVHKIVPTADRAKATVLTKIAFIERDDHVLPEMSAKVTFLSKETDRSKAGAPAKLTVPVSSVLRRGDASVVFIVRDGAVTETPVEAGEVMGDRVEIKQGLNPGDQVVTRPDPELTSGMTVRTKTG